MADGVRGSSPMLNRPSLHAIEYRLGSYPSFRRRMLEQISRWRRTADAPTSQIGGTPPTAPTTRPLAAWTTRAPDDFGIAFVEMWAYLADILTFYQERIANEAYLRTSVQAGSTRKLVSLIGYRPAPGRAAVAQLAFETERDAVVELPAGLLIQSVPGQDEKPQKFETLAALTAYASLNELRPRTLERQALTRGARRAVLEGVGHDIRPGNWVAICGDERRRDPGSERWDVRRVSTVEEDEQARTTTVSWLEGLGTPRRPGRGAIDPDPNPEFWVFRGQAWPFGYNAPDQTLMAATLETALARAREEAGPTAGTGTDGTVTPTTQPPVNNYPYLPQESSDPTALYLDSAYPGIIEGGWVALLTSTIDPAVTPDLAGYDEYVELYPVARSMDTAYFKYFLAGRSTKVTLDTAAGELPGPEHIGYFPVRGSIVLIAPERIPFAEVPIGHSALGSRSSLASPVEWTSIELDRLYPDLRRGRTLVVSGTRLDANGQPLGPGSEAVVVAAVDSDAERTTVRLVQAMSGRYDRESVVIYGNVAAASHGESVRTEVLGDGDAANEFQSFTLKKKPVTYVPAPGAAGGVASTLTLRVDDVRWAEVADLYGQPADARVYATRRDSAQATLVRAGDGRSGAAFTSGRNNVTADYRVGLGPEGNVGANSIRTLLKKPLGLKAVSNPGIASGGANPEDAAAVKRTAPGTVRTFGRIVSIRDFEDAALEYVGVAKARARYVWDGEARVVSLVVAGDDGATLDVAATGLLGDLDSRRDSHQPLQIENFTKRPIVVRASIKIDPAYVAANIVAAADAAIRARLAFDALELGEALALSDIHRAASEVPGVIAVDVDELRFKAQEPGELEPRLLVGPNELVWVVEATDVVVVRAGDEIGVAA